MFITESFNAQLDDLLIRICEKLQISESQHKQATERYNAVGKWLAQDDGILSKYNPVVYPQGSLSIGTTVRPLKYQEYDVDLVCELEIAYEKSDPVAVLNAIETQLKQDKTYESMIEKKNRCIRLNYANEFHMDILPACPNGFENNGKLKVPDRELKEWKDSNPKGYAAWFQGKVDLCRAAFIKAAEDVEPLPQREPLERKLPLKRVVQLIKRYRDVYFKKDEKSAPISIVLTTLAGYHYKGQISVNESLKYALSKIVEIIPQKGRLVVLNPTNTDEDLSERWDDDMASYFKFVKWINEFNKIWDVINKSRGIPNITKILKEMFGEQVTDEALKEQEIIIKKAREEKLLGITTGTGILSSTSKTNSIPVKKNTFYGA